LSVSAFKALKGSRLDFRKLSPLSRILLAAEGTVTRLLEAWTLEPIGVSKLSQRCARLRSRFDPLGLPSGSRVMIRRIVLVGKRSRVPYVFAESRIALDHLEPRVRETLLHTEQPLGQVLQRFGVATTWEMLDARIISHRGQARILRVPAGGKLLERRYRIFGGGKPTFFITERFAARLGE
jgi:chorismate-pyruvate lyase